MKPAFEAMRELMTPPAPSKRPIGFVTHEEKQKDAKGSRGKKAA